MPVLPLLLYFFVCWLLLTVGAYFRPWLLLPDITVMVLLYLFYYQPRLPLWRAFLPISFLLDLSAQVSIGFHGVLYGLTALLIFPLHTYWRTVSVFEQLLGVIFLGAGFIVLKFLLLYIVEGIPAPAGWLWCFLLQLAAWPLMRMLSLIFMQYYGGRVRR